MLAIVAMRLDRATIFIYVPMRQLTRQEPHVGFREGGSYDELRRCSLSLLAAFELFDFFALKLDDTICYCFHVPTRKILNFIRTHKPRRTPPALDYGGPASGAGWCVAW